MDTNSNVGLMVLIALVVIVCCCALAVVGAAGAVFFMAGASGPPRATAVGPVPATPAARITPQPTPDPAVGLTPGPHPVTDETLRALETTIVPSRDLRELAMRLLGIAGIPKTVSDVPANHQVGDVLDFNASNTDTLEQFVVTAQLIYRTENVYFFAEEGVRVNQAAVKKLVDEFQTKTYPTNREFFGVEWNPGVDGDPALYILFARNLGSTGYYSSKDQYSRLAHKYSNEKEMFYINADHVTPGDSFLPSVLAHEFQHMIHWYHDINEETWMNEGSSELAAFLNGYGASGWEDNYLDDTDLQLNAWTEDGSGGGAHYGAAFLFMTYFLDRFGSAATQSLIAHPANGMRAVDAVLADGNFADPATGQPITAIDVFRDWLVANYLGDEAVGDGRYFYHNFPKAPTITFPTDSFNSCPLQTKTATVRQYAADYYVLNCTGEITIEFAGAQQSRVVPTVPHSGRFAFWANREDESDTTFTRAFDLSGLTTATLKYWAWWQIETDWDYVYLEVSTDEGRTWEIINTPSGTGTDPNGNNFGWGYTGDSGGGSQAEWIEETVDLSAFAGQKIWLRFEYITDAAVNRPGFMLDDVSIPELNYTADFEGDAGGWEADGWVRMDNVLPQTYVVQVIQQGQRASQTTIHRLELDAANQGSLTLTLANREKAVLIVAGTTRYTTEQASYQFGVR